MCAKHTIDYFKQEKVWKTSLLPYQQHVLNDILSIIPKDVQSILDVGCGNGHITNALPISIKVTGLDLSEEALQYVQRDKVVGDITALPFPDGSFDLVMANDVIEHLLPRDRNRGLNELARVAAKYVLITVPFLEDLNVGATKCGACKRYYHVNHHLASFGLNETGELLASLGFKCNTQILSGDIWHNEPVDIIYLKRALQVELARHEGAICPYCGSSELAPTEHAPVLLPLINKLESQICLENKEIIDLGMLRTECISLYSKDVEPIFKSDGFINALGQKVLLEKEIINNNSIDFTKPELFQKAFLPLYSRLPYFVGTGAEKKGVYLTKEERLLFGFFCAPIAQDGKLELKLSGSASDKCTLAISSYHDTEGYLTPISVEVHGEFTVAIPIANAEVAIFGVLFEIRTTDNSVTLSFASVSNVQSNTCCIYKNIDAKARLMRLSAPGNVYLSLPIYGPYILETEWMRSSNLLNESLHPLVFEQATSSLEGIWHRFYNILLSEYTALKSQNEVLQAEYQALNSAYEKTVTRRIKRLLSKLT